MLRAMGNDIVTVIACIALMAGGAYLVGLVGGLVVIPLRFIARSILYPIEGRLLRWLQDRATARLFGTSIEAVRIRRRADTGSA